MLNRYPFFKLKNMDIKKLNILLNQLPENGSFKHVQSLLKKICEVIPKTAYIANKNQIIAVHDLIEKEIKNTNVFDNPTPQINISLHQNIITQNEVYFYASNKNRIKKAWNENGKKGVIDYILWIDKNNKAINSANQNGKVSSLVTQKIKASISEFLQIKKPYTFAGLIKTIPKKIISFCFLQDN